MFGLLRKKRDVPEKTDPKALTAAERRIYIIDFDRTITIMHTGAVAYGSELDATFILKNVKKGFADFVRRVNNSGHIIYIASYSDDANAGLVEGEALSGHDLIKYYMDLIFGPDQTIFTAPQKNSAGENVSLGNIIASNSQDYKQYHLGMILEQEGLNQDSPDDKNTVHVLHA
jgi:hypothetical protein